jgi:hypothetical protein
MSGRAHGTRAKYVVEKCRCDPCTAANRVYARERERRINRDRLGTGPPHAPYVDAAPAREHLEWLSSVGVGRRTIAQRTGVSLSALLDIKTGRHRRIRPETESKILAVGKFDRPKSTRVDATETFALIEDLLYLGLTKVRIAEALGCGRSLQLAKSKMMTVTRIERVRKVYVQLVAALPQWHGTYAGYAKRKCRCLRCTARASELARERRRVA